LSDWAAEGNVGLDGVPKEVIDKAICDLLRCLKKDIKARLKTGQPPGSVPVAETEPEKELRTEKAVSDTIEAAKVCRESCARGAGVYVCMFLSLFVVDSLCARAPPFLLPLLRMLALAPYIIMARSLAICSPAASGRNTT
jgi:hypothetical protein